MIATNDEVQEVIQNIPKKAHYRVRPPKGNPLRLVCLRRAAPGQRY
jgi:hypothetical protein